MVGRTPDPERWLDGFKILAYVVGVLVGLRLLQRVLVWTRTLTCRFRIPTVRLVDAEGVPLELDPVFAVAAETLTRLGFSFSHRTLVESIELDEPPRPHWIFVHPPTRSYAAVSPAIHENGTRLFDVCYTTWFGNGDVVATFDGLEHVSLTFPPAWECHDHHLNDPVAQWKAHGTTVSGRPDAATTLLLPPEEMAARESAMLGDLVRHLEREGMLRRDSGTEQWRMLARPGWRLAGRMLAGMRRAVAAQRTAAPDRVDPAARVAADTFAFERLSETERRRAQRRSGQTVMFLISMVAFVLVFGVLLSWRLVPWLLVTVFVHELGHYLGMVAFGYRDRRMLFVPFLGAATMGRKDDATAAQRITVYLLGPLPGIALGFLAWGAHVRGIGGAWLLDFALISLIINYFNLLPVVPLDGGRVVETLFLSRIPQAQALFLAASAAAFEAGAYVFHDPIMLAIAIAMVLALPSKWRWGVAARRITRRGPVANRPAALHRIFATLGHHTFARTTLSQRLQLARGLLDFLQMRRVGFLAVVGGGMAYVVALAVPPAVYTHTVLGAGGLNGELYADEAWWDEAAAVAQWEAAMGPAAPDSVWTLQWELSERHLTAGRTDTAVQYLRRALTTAAAFGEDDDRYRRTAAALARAEGKVTGRRTTSQALDVPPPPR